MSIVFYIDFQMSEVQEANGQCCFVLMRTGSTFLHSPTTGAGALNGDGW